MKLMSNHSIYIGRGLLCCLQYCQSLVLHVLEKHHGEQSLDSSLSSNEPIKSPDTNHQQITSIVSSHNENYQPIKSYDTNYMYTTNGSIKTTNIPNAPVRNPLKVSIPSSKSTRSKHKSLQSAADQLGVKSHPPMRVNGGTLSHIFFAFRLLLSCCYFYIIVPELLEFSFLI